MYNLKMKDVYVLLILVFMMQTSLVQAANYRQKDLKKDEWGAFKLTWLEDQASPLVTFSLYFQSGAVLDKAQEAGLTEATLDLLYSGTKKESREKLQEFFDFYGVQFSHQVTHEYVALSLTTLVKDLPEVTKKFCEVVAGAEFPREELVPYKSKKISSLKNLTAQPSALADRAFRAITMRASSYEYPVEGRIASLELLQSEQLKKKWAHLRDQATKRIYMKGPKESLFIKEQFLSQCQFKTAPRQSYRQKNPISSNALKIYLVPVNGNQAQIRVGRFLSHEETADPDEKLSFTSSYLGGGFTAKLIQEIRVKLGLTYSIGSTVSMQADYGRSVISTSTRNESAVMLLQNLKSILDQSRTIQGIEVEQMKHMKNYVIGKYPFLFEGAQQFLSQLMLLDHLQQPYQKLYQFPEKIKKIQPQDIADGVNHLFNWDELVIVVVGDLSLAKELEKVRPVEILKSESIL
jgi:zinc protease